MGIEDSLEHKINRQATDIVFQYYQILNSKRDNRTFKPTVKDLVNSSKFAFSFLWFNSKAIDELSVNVFQTVYSSQLAKLLNRPNTYHLLTVLWNPQRNGHPPESVSGDAPILIPIGARAYFEANNFVRACAQKLHKLALKFRGF